jgi:hypothetical protein
MVDNAHGVCHCSGSIYYLQLPCYVPVHSQVFSERKIDGVYNNTGGMGSGGIFPQLSIPQIRFYIHKSANRKNGTSTCISK